MEQTQHHNSKLYYLNNLDNVYLTSPGPCECMDVFALTDFDSVIPIIQCCIHSVIECDGHKILHTVDQRHNAK